MDQLHEQGKNNMATSKLTVSLDSNDKKIFTLMCKDIGFTNPSEAVKVWVKDCIRKQSILGIDCDIPEEVDDNDQEERFDCDIPEEVDDNDQEERSLIDSGSLAQLDQEKGK